MPRRQTILPPGTPLDAVPGLPLVWDARLALGRLWQVYRRVIQTPSLDQGYRWRSQPMPAVVKELAKDCGIRIGPWPGRVVTPCPTCRAEVYLLRGTRWGWTCQRCDQERWRQLEVSIAAYAMGIRIGLGGRPMVRRWKRLLVALARLASRARTVDDHCLLVMGACVIQYSPHWRRYKPRGESPRVSRDAGPISRAWGPLYVQAMIDSLIHPAAFHERFA